MPSWNIHIAHVEHLIETASPQELGLEDLNCFLFGNVVPDVYVGYMVKDITRKIEYKDTHLAEASFIPKPDASRFYQTYIAGKPSSAVTLGAWCHLIADHYYNKHTIDYIDRIGVRPGTETRIKKQADFDVFGRTLEIQAVPHESAALFAACEAFPQYGLDPTDVVNSINVCAAIVDKNAKEHVAKPTYQLLTPDFFSDTFREVSSKIEEALRLNAAGIDASHIGRP